MRTISTLFAIFALLGEPGLCQQKLIPYNQVFVSVNTKPLIDRKNKGSKLNVSVRMSKGSEGAEDSASVDVDCYDFSSEKRMMPEKDLEAFFEMGKAALAGEKARKEVLTETFRGEVTTVYEVAEADNGKIIRMTRGDESADFPPEEAERVRAALTEAEIGRAWYEKILTATELPAETPDARPPRSDGYYLDSQIGEVSGRGISYEVSISANGMLGNHTYEISHGLLLYTDGRMTGSMSGGWVEALLLKVTLALDAAKDGRNFSFKSGEDDGRSYTVKANPATKEADLELNLSDFFKDREPRKAHFGVAQLEEIRRLIDEYEVRQKWFEDNEGLFFKPVEKKE
jgi:hypothetical protein